MHPGAESYSIKPAHLGEASRVQRQLLMASNVEGKTILVIEDNESERQGLACLLEQDGYTVMQASDGAEAIKQVHEQTPPDMMLLDMMMRGCDGWQFLRQRLCERALDCAIERIQRRQRSLFL